MDPRNILYKLQEGMRSASCHGHNRGFEFVVVYSLIWLNCLWNMFKGLWLENFGQNKDKNVPALDNQSPDSKLKVE